MKEMVKRLRLQPIYPQVADDSQQPTHLFGVGNKDESKLVSGTTRVTFPALAHDQEMPSGTLNSMLAITSRERWSFGGHGDPFCSSISIPNEGLFMDRDMEVPLLEVGLGSTSRRSETDDTEGQDAKVMQNVLLSAFPESLKHITTDEASVEALTSENAESATDSGYHRQFTEFALREVYFLLMSAASANEVRLRYLLRQNTMDMDELNSKSIQAAIMEESTRSLSEWSDAWYQTPHPKSEVLTAVTVRPPQFVAGMLWNGSDSFLLGGTAYLQEGRILQIRLQCGNRSTESASTSPTNGGSFVTSDNACRGGDGCSGQKCQVRLLLREFISVSKVGMGSMVQTFSLIPEYVPAKVTRNQTLPYDLIQAVLDMCSPGAVSRAFSLQMLLPRNLRSGNKLSAFDETTESFGVGGPTMVGCSFGDRESDSNEIDGGCTLSLTRSSSSIAHTRCSISAKRFSRQPLGNEAYLVYTNPKLYAVVMKYSPAVLTSHTNAIREYLKYSQRLRFQRQIQRLLAAVYTIQRFFRHCIAKKGRAVNRMLKRWGQLELDSREQLKKYTLSPATVDRIGFIVGSVLWQHIVTTKEYKMAILEEQFSLRRAAYRKWCAQRLEEDRAKCTSARSADISVSLVSDAGWTEKVSSTTCSETGITSTVHGGDMIDVTLGRSHHRWISKWEYVLHARFGWYIDPEELLQESHRRLLISLRSSILQMADVQEEMKKKANISLALL
ncbi:hypothetical protein TraAM80_00623 [Trypanosoma rangeli]|uniref:Uncharacterized protein n=1 Tax=Trypanosoma rangeli TaxID=5698 RepID=A0A422P2I1_TRYRA|nr:uncharacterized protein TraAM80_00623 [Trypanosoma rangeli]RNF11928.1 hypothetical protein TraAM80_00623 [Trypanosoma rangeli]|eukprot:RNF11928.1 hypothetical protein TraAM80_00623 [Trypanosoma rangeli]